MAKRSLKGCGCVIAVLAVVLVVAGVVGWKYVLPWWKLKPPPPSGGELQVHVLDVGPGEGDSILIITPGGKSVLIDAGDAGKGKVVLDALKRYNVEQLDYFVATHPHPDHIGGADEVFKATKVLNVIDNGLEPDVPQSLATQSKPATPGSKNSGNKPASASKSKAASITRFYDEYKEAITQSGAHYQKAQAGATYDLGGGTRLTVLAPIDPPFTKDQLKTGGKLPKDKSNCLRFGFWEILNLFAGVSEEEKEKRNLTKEL